MKCVCLLPVQQGLHASSKRKLSEDAHTLTSEPQPVQELVGQHPYHLCIAVQDAPN